MAKIKFNFSFESDAVEKTKKYISKMPAKYNKKLFIYAAMKLVKESLSKEDYDAMDEVFKNADNESLILLINILLDMDVQD